MGEYDWLVPGAKAVILQPFNHGSMRAESVTIERVMKRDVVLSNGDRFSAHRLQKQVGGSWGSTLYLVPASDPRVAETRVAIRERRLRDKATYTYEKWRHGDVSATEVAAAFNLVATTEPATRPSSEGTL